MEYRKQIEVIESQLIKENKEYMGRINGPNIYSFFIAQLSFAFSYLYLYFSSDLFFNT